MPRDYINIGATPPEEPCIGVGTPRHDYARRECEVYKRQLEREYPKGAFRVKSFPHDFGTYCEVVAYFGGEEGTEEEEEAAFAAEGDASPVWDETSLKELREQLGDWYFTEIRK